MSVFVCSVFVSLPLCRLAKPPVPKPHLWSPGKWLIWKYNHSGQDFISSLSYSLFPLSSLHLSYLIHHQTNFCLVFVSYCVTFPIFLALIKTAKSSPLLRLCSWAQFSQHVLLRSVSSCTQWSIWRDRTLLSPNLIYGEKERVWLITN